MTDQAQAQAAQAAAPEAVPTDQAQAQAAQAAAPVPGPLAFTKEQIKVAMLKADKEWQARRGQKGPGPSHEDYLVALGVTDAAPAEMPDKHDRSGKGLPGRQPQVGAFK